MSTGDTSPGSGSVIAVPVSANTIAAMNPAYNIFHDLIFFDPARNTVLLS
jgi:hypothetical protein